MIEVGGSEEDRRRLAGFDGVAEDYDRTRPVFPDVLFDDLVALTGLAAGDRVLEIGCGTGQATVPLSRSGLAVTAGRRWRCSTPCTGSTPRCATPRRPPCSLRVAHRGRRVPLGPAADAERFWVDLQEDHRTVDFEGEPPPEPDPAVALAPGGGRLVPGDRAPTDRAGWACYLGDC